MSSMSLTNFFSGRPDHCERVISALQFVTNSEGVDQQWDEEGLAAVLEKGLLYRGMIEGFNALPLSERLRRIAENFAEYESLHLLGPGIDMTLPCVAAGHHAPLQDMATAQDAVLDGIRLVCHACHRERVTESIEGEERAPGKLSLFLLAGEEMYVYILDPRRILRGESTSSSCGDEVNWGLALRIGTDVTLEPLTEQCISQWIQRLAAIAQDTESEGAPVVRISLSAAIPVEHLTSMCAAHESPEQLVRRMEREMGSLRRYHKEESILALRQTLQLSVEAKSEVSAFQNADSSPAPAQDTPSTAAPSPQPLPQPQQEHTQPSRRPSGDPTSPPSGLTKVVPTVNPIEVGRHDNVKQCQEEVKDTQDDGQDREARHPPEDRQNEGSELPENVLPEVFMCSPRPAEEPTRSTDSRGSMTGTSPPLELLRSIEGEDVAAFSARAYQFMRDAALQGCLTRESLGASIDIPTELIMSVEGGEDVAAFTARAYEFMRDTALGQLQDEEDGSDGEDRGYGSGSQKEGLGQGSGELGSVEDVDEIEGYGCKGPDDEDVVSAEVYSTVEGAVEDPAEEERRHDVLPQPRCSPHSDSKKEQNLPSSVTVAESVPVPVSSEEDEVQPPLSNLYSAHTKEEAEEEQHSYHMNDLLPSSLPVPVKEPEEAQPHLLKVSLRLEDGSSVRPQDTLPASVSNVPRLRAEGITSASVLEGGYGVKKEVTPGRQSAPKPKSLLQAAGQRSFDKYEVKESSKLSPPEYNPNEVFLKEWSQEQLRSEAALAEMDISIPSERHSTSPLSRSLQSFMDHTNRSEGKDGESALQKKVNRSQDGSVEGPAEESQNLSEHEVTHMSSLVAADIDRLLGFEENEVSGVERRGTIDEDGEMERWMEKEISDNIPISEGTMKRLDQWVGNEDSNSSDEDEAEIEVYRSEQYTSIDVPQEPDLLASVDVLEVSRIDKSDAFQRTADSASTDESQENELCAVNAASDESQENEVKKSHVSVFEDRDITIYVPEKRSEGLPSPQCSPPSISKNIPQNHPQNVPKNISGAPSMDPVLREQLIAVSAQIEGALRLAEVERTRKRRELGFLCLTQFYQSKGTLMSPNKVLPYPPALSSPPPSVSIQEERRRIGNSELLEAARRPLQAEWGSEEVSSPHSVRTASTAGTKRSVVSVRTGPVSRVGHTSPGSKSVSSQQSAPIGVNQLREMMESVERNTDNNTVKNTARNTGNNTVEKNTGSTVQNSVKDTVLDPPKELKVQPAVPENEVNRGREVNLPTPEKEVRKVRKMPPQPPGLTFIDGSNPPKRFQNEVIRSEPPPPLTVRSEVSDKKEVNEVASVLSEEQSLLEEKKRIQKKMQKKMNVLEARNRERSRSRSRGRGYGSRRNSGTVEGAEDRSVLEDEERIVENHSEHRAPSRYHEAGADDAQSMFSAGSGGKRSVHKGRPDLPALPATAQKVSAPQRRPVVMDDAAMLQLEKEVAMINDLIGLKAEGAELEQDRDRDRVADPREREQDIAPTAKPRPRPASVGRAGSAGRPRREGGTTLTNIQQIRNAIQYVCLAGGADNSIREQVLSLINTENEEYKRKKEQQLHDDHEGDIDSDPFHLILLLQDNSLGFKGVYRYRQSTGGLVRLCGKQGCPKVIDERCVAVFYKYETSSRSFKAQTTTTHINNTTDALCLDMAKMRRLHSR